MSGSSRLVVEGGGDAGNLQYPITISYQHHRSRVGEPNIRDVQREDLFSFTRMETLYRQAVRAGLAEASEAGALNFLAAACRAREVEGEAPKIFMGIVRKRLWKHITQADEDRALSALRKYRAEEPGRFRVAA